MDSFGIHLVSPKVYSPSNNEQDSWQSEIGMVHMNAGKTDTTFKGSPKTTFNDLEQNEDNYDDEDLDLPLYQTYFTYTNVAILVSVFLCEIMYSRFEFASFYENPTIGFSAAKLKEMGAKYTPLILEGEWWRLFTPMFLHAGFLHLLLNLWAFFRVSFELEQEYGWMRLCFIYLLSGLSATLCSAVFLPKVLSVGASGAIYGVFGSVLGDLFHNWRYILADKKRFLFTFCISLSIGFVIGLIPLIDNFNHIGGLFAGILASMLLYGHSEMISYDTPKQRNIRNTVCIISFFLLVTWFFILFFLLFSKETTADDFCPWCHNLGCVETPWWGCSMEQCFRKYSNGTMERVSNDQCS